MAFRTIFLALLIVALASAFVPARPAFASKTQLQFKFLKDLGLEKPSWLPDFGDKKEEPEKDEASASKKGDAEEEEKETPAEGE